MTVAAYDVARANAPHRAALAAAMVAVLDRGQLVLGEAVEAFERQFAGYCGTAHCVGVGNGLDALVLALRAFGVGPGDEVVVPAFTFAATWLAAAQLGAVPVPVDVRPDGLMDPALIGGAIGPRTRAIVPVHLFGTLADMPAILPIAEAAGVPVLEDAAQAHGATLGGRCAGSFGTAAAFSFYPAKNLGALGDGGAVCTGDPALAARIRLLRNYGSARKYHHEALGQNSRLDAIQAACLSVKLPFLDAANARRRVIAARYWAGLAGAGLGFVAPGLAGGAVWHQFVLRTAGRDRLQAGLAALGIGTLVHYPVAPFDQPCFAGRYDRARYPVAAALADTVLSLPMGDYLRDDEVDRVIGATLDAGRFRAAA